MTLQSDTVLQRASELKAAGKSFALVTVVRCESPTSAKPGAKALVDAEGNIEGWIGGGCAQPAVIDTVKKALKDGQPRLIRVSPGKGGTVEEGIIDFGMTCHSGGTLDIFIDPVVPRPVLLIIGASPAAQALAALASRAGFDVNAAFPGADRGMFPDALQVVDSLDAGVLQADTPAFVVVATQGKRDEGGLEAALATGAPYIAFIASERKAGKLREYLIERGHDAQRVAAIVSPAGVEIGAVSYEEIALSVLAGLVRARRMDGIGAAVVPEAQQAAVAAADATAPAGTATVTVQSGKADAGTRASVAESATDPVCGMRVAVAGAEFVSEYQGQRYYFCCAGCQHSFEKSPAQYLQTEAGGA
jgi:xanthine dehydrogenase accessory factor